MFTSLLAKESSLDFQTYDHRIVVGSPIGTGGDQGGFVPNGWEFQGALGTLFESTGKKSVRYCQPGVPAAIRLQPAL